MIRPSGGSGFVLGKRIDDAKESVELRRRVAYVAEDERLYGYMTVEQTIAFTRSFFADWREDRAVKLLKPYELPPQRKVRALSKGMRTKLALLLAGAPTGVVDSGRADRGPGSGVDRQPLEGLVMAAADGTTVFFSSHQIEGEYAAPLASLGLVFAMGVLGDGGLRPYNPLMLIQAGQYLDQQSMLFTTPFPWAHLGVNAGVAVLFIAAAVKVIERREF